MNGKRFWLFMSALFFVLTCTACEREQDQLYSQAMASSSSQVEEQTNSVNRDAPNYIGPDSSALQDATPVPDDLLRGELTIKTDSFLDSSSISFLAEEFMQLHPNVNIRFDYELGEAELLALPRTERNLRRESYYAQLRVELAAGEGDYILYNVKENLNLPQMSGVLTDLRDYWENDLEIDPDEYFAPVVEAFAIDGKMAILPFSFKYNGLFFSKPIMQSLNIELEDIDSVDTDDVLNWYEEAQKATPDLNLIFASPGKELLFAAEKPRYMDLQSKTAAFQSSTFLQFLTRTAVATNTDPDLDPESELGYSDPGLMNEKIRCTETGADPSATLGGFADMFGHLVQASRPAFAAQMNVDTAGMISILWPMEYVAGPYPYTSSDGQLGITSSESFAVPASCKNKDLAWEFIKHCIAPRKTADFSHLGSRQRYTSDIPLSKTNFGNCVTNLSENGISGIVAPPQFDSLKLEDMVAALEEILAFPLVNADAYGVDVQEILDEFYIHALTTPDQCAKKLQDRADIWLNE